MTDLIKTNQIKTKTIKKESKNKCLAIPISNYEIGIDEVGRGPLFGPVYAAAVILPAKYESNESNESNNFAYHLMKDSKKFSSPVARSKVADYIKANAIWWAVESVSETVIGEINILNATMAAMHKCLDKLPPLELVVQPFTILVDGTYFIPYKDISHTCVVAGDSTYASIAAASILAKVARDTFIQDLATEHPFLDTCYDISSNKGYGTKKHMDGIAKYGITEWHRTTFGPCKGAWSYAPTPLNPIEPPN